MAGDSFRSPTIPRCLIRRAAKIGEAAKGGGGGTISGPVLLSFCRQKPTHAVILARVGDMSDVCACCRTRECATAGRRAVRPDCAGRRSPPVSVCETCADSGFAPSSGLWAPNGAAHCRCHFCSAPDSVRHCEGAVEEYTNRRDPLFVCKDIFVVFPWLVVLRRVSPVELRRALLRVKKHLPPANTRGLEDTLGLGGEVPAGGAPLLLTSARMRGSGSRAEQVAAASVDRIRLRRTPRMRYEY